MRRLPVALLLVAAVLAVAARELLAVPHQVHDASGPGVAAKLVGAADAIRLRRSLRLAERAGAAGKDGVRLRGLAESGLAAEAPRSAQAANLLGVFSLADGAADPANGPRFAADAASAFAAAIRLDPAGEDAKFNLELLLTLRPRAASAASAEQAKGHKARGGSRAAPVPKIGY